MERYLCVHGHFYQPPRENPWLEAIEVQDSAYPYHDWNERITAECYAPNAVSRILDEQGRILRIVNNYSRMSFNFGPTLLSWLERHSPPTYAAILEGDRASRERYGGHGSALAQAYNHVILPLASRADKISQVRWGIRDFEHRFARQPEGLWLPETAVDLESLEVLAAHGIRFTILEPRQARRVRPKDASRWRDVGASGIDPTMAYEQRLPSGRSIALFFYDGPISRAVAFERLLEHGEGFVRRMLGAFSDRRTWPQLVHVATDGETYGHHHRFGEMALAFALDHLESKKPATLINYGQYLERHPPTQQVEIAENTSWSCAHGVERWRADCGCRVGGRPGWNQAWRAPLRQALDWLRNRLEPAFEERAREFLRDPWEARDDYVDVVLDRSAATREAFLSRHALRHLAPGERVTVWKLLELERHAMLMYTSCGWFFDDLSGIETVQILEYAARAVQLAGELFGEDLEPAFLALLEQARSNLPEHGNGRTIYLQQIAPARVDLPKVAAHYAVSHLLEPSGDRPDVYGYRIDRGEDRLFEKGRARAVVGRLRVASTVVEEEADLTYGVLHFGDHNLTAGVRAYRGEEDHAALVEAVTRALEAADLPGVLHALDAHFEGLTYSLKTLFRDEQRRMVSRILEATLDEVGGVYRQLYDHHAPLMRFLAGLGTPLPAPLRSAGEFALNERLREAVRAETPDAERIRRLVEDAREENVTLDTPGLGFGLQKSLERRMERLREEPADLTLLFDLSEAVQFARSLPFPVSLWKVENDFYAMMREHYPGFELRADQGDAVARAWVGRFAALAERLRIRVG